MENNIGINEYQCPWEGPAKGWQCPVCGRVYSPSTPMCWYCGGNEKKTNVVRTGTDPNYLIDWCRHTTTTLDTVPEVTLRGFMHEL